MSAKHSIDEIHNRLFLRVHQAANLAHKKGSAALVDFGVTTQQWAALACLSRPQVENGLTVNEMCDYLRVSRQNISPMLLKLEKMGLLARAPDAHDRRARRVVLTREGWGLLDKIAPIMQNFYQESLQGIPRDEQIAIVHHLNRLLRNV